MRLIDADALKKALKEHFSDEDDDVELIEIGACWYHGAVLEKIDNAPTVDLEEIKHMYFQIGYKEGEQDAYEEGYKMGKFHAREEIARCKD